MARLAPSMLAAGLALAGLHVGVAHAGPSERSTVAMFPVTFAEQVPEDARSDLQSGMVAGLDRGSMTVVRPPRVAAQLATTDGGPGCVEAGCLIAVAQGLGADYLLRITASKRDRDYDLKLEVHGGVDGRVVVSRDVRCELCGLAEFAQRANDEVAALVPQLEALGRGPATVTVTSVPSGADVFVDGRRAGRTPYEAEIAPGRHQVRIERAGYGTQTRTVVAARGSQAGLAVELDRVRRPIHPAWGWSSLGVGVGTVAGGVALLVLDERPVKSDCSGNNVDINGTCRRRFNTLAGGIALTVTGAALISTGIALVVISRRAKSRVSPRPGGVAIAF